MIDQRMFRRSGSRFAAETCAKSDSTAVAQAFQQQNSATQQIGHNFQEAARVTGKLSSNIVDVDEADGKTGSAADQVLASAEQRRPRGIT